MALYYHFLRVSAVVAPLTLSFAVKAGLGAGLLVSWGLAAYVGYSVLLDSVVLQTASVFEAVAEFVLGRQSVVKLVFEISVEGGVEVVGFGNETNNDTKAETILSKGVCS